MDLEHILKDVLQRDPRVVFAYLYDVKRNALDLSFIEAIERFL